MATQTATAVLPPRVNLVVRFWNGLTRPHPSLTDIETIRQSRLLAGLTFNNGIEIPTENRPRPAFT